MNPMAHSKRRRLVRRPWPFKIIGLTGSIAMGKSTAASLLTHMGYAVSDADAIVHQLSAPDGEALPAIAKRFPDVMDGEKIDRQALGKIVLKDPKALADLESILHPLVYKNRHRFFQAHARRRSRCVILDVPLLFETGGDHVCDDVIVVSAPLFLQRQRALRRPGMTEEKLSRILGQQMSDGEKRRKANASVPSGLGKRETLRHLRRILSKALSRRSNQV